MIFILNNVVLITANKIPQIVMKAINETTDNAWQTTVAKLQEDTDAGTPQQVYISALF